VGRNGFLHISDVEARYFRQGGFDPEELMRDNPALHDADTDDGARRPAPRHGNGRHGDRHPKRRNPSRGNFRPRVKPPIQEVFQRGDEVLVQVIKEGIGNKGPTLSTYVSIPGRYLVLMPALGRVGVSRKIEDEDERRRLKEILYELNPPRGLGFIVRTAGHGRSRRELSRDLAYLLRLWKVIVRRIQKQNSPVDIYEESDMIIRTIRDIVSADIDTIHIDEEQAYERAKEFLKLVMPRQASKLQLYKGKDPLFHNFRLEEEISRIHSREVPLPDGGSIVIDQTEALVAIDVNSGSFRIDDSAEETAFRLNLAAAKEIARQLRLRDLGGVIVNDFIDMRREKHRRGLERALRDAMKRDRARTKILRTSPFGLIEMTRQRIRPGLKRSVYEDCPCCKGRGVVKSEESMALDVIRKVMLATQQPNCVVISVRVHEKVASFLNNQKRRELSELEGTGKTKIRIMGSESVYPEHLELECRDDKGNPIQMPKGH
jgi:ribonuclease E